VTSLLPPTWHPALVGVLALAAAGYALVTTRRGVVASRAQRLRLALALVVLYLAYAWPLGDLATHVSVSAVVVQRLLVILAVAPLLITALPDDLVATITRPVVLDRASRACGHPAVAIVVVTVVGTVTLLPPVVTWGASSSGAGAVLATVTLLLTSLSFIWIFSQHVLYPSFAHQQAVLGLSAIDDQQLAGYIAKLGAYLPLWVIAFLFFSRAADESAAREEPPLRWIDVQRELERVERDHRRAHVPPDPRPAHPDGPP